MIVGTRSDAGSGKYATLSRVGVTGRLIPSGSRSRDTHAPAVTTTACASIVAPSKWTRPSASIRVTRARPARVTELELVEEDGVMPGAGERVRRRGAHDTGADDGDLGALDHAEAMLLVHRRRGARQAEEALDVAHALNPARRLDE